MFVESCYRGRAAQYPHGVRIAYVGGFTQTWYTEAHVADAFERLGHEVLRIEASTLTWRQLADGIATTNVDALMASARPLKDECPDDVAVAQELTKRLPTMSYHLDVYRGLAREWDIGQAPWWHMACVFTADGGTPPWYWETRGVSGHHYMPAAVPANECYLADPDDRYRARIAFVGARRYHPEWQYRGELIRWLERTYPQEFRCFPTNGRRIHGDELNRLYSSVDVVVGDSFAPHHAHDFYWSDRVYQTLGRGGFLIHPAIGGFSSHFEDGVHLRTYTYGDYIHLRKLIDHYLANEDERRVIAERGHRHVKALHTYDQRAAAMLFIATGVGG